MRTLRAAIVLTVVGLVLCLWLLVRVNWYNFLAFMLLAQPLLLVGLLIFLGVAARQLGRNV